MMTTITIESTAIIMVVLVVASNLAGLLFLVVDLIMTRVVVVGMSELVRFTLCDDVEDDEDDGAVGFVVVIIIIFVLFVLSGYRYFSCWSLLLLLLLPLLYVLFVWQIMKYL